MAIVELDPLFIRALRLLHSKSKESEIQLKGLLDECIRQRKAGLPINVPTPPVSSSLSNKGRENEKNLDRLKRDLSQLVPGGGVPNKRPRLEPSASGSGSAKLSSSSMTPSPQPITVEEHEDMDLDLAISLNDCTCCICKSFNQETGNKLMECHTCQNLYHQECHNPVITDEEVADPRLVWNCSNCSTTIQQTIPSKAASSAPTISKSQPKPISAKALAASTTASRVMNRGGSGSSGSSSSSSQMNTADKRLQMMKKKAASSSVPQRKGK